MEQHFSEHFPSWCTESENLHVTGVVWTGYNSLKKKKKMKLKKTHKKKQTKMVKGASGRKDRLFTKFALVSENGHVCTRR